MNIAKLFWLDAAHKPRSMLMLVSAWLWSFCSNGVLGQASNNEAGGQPILPLEARLRLDKQAANMGAVYLEFEERRLKRDADHPNAVKTFFVTFAGNRFYERRHTVVLESGKQSTQDIDRAFDGEFVYVGDPKQSGRNDTAVLVKYSVDDITDPDRPKLLFQFPYLDAAGFYAPEYIPEVNGFSGIQSLVTHFLERGELKEVTNTDDNLRITMLVLRPSYNAQQPTNAARIISFLLNPNYGYAVIERDERTLGGQRIFHVVNQDWRHYESPDIWLPQQCTARYYVNEFNSQDPSDEPVSIISYRLNRISFGDKQAPFALTTFSEYSQRGTRISDRTLPEARSRADHTVSYTVAANGDLLRDSAGAVSNTMNRGKRIFWYCAFVLLIGLPPSFVLLWWMKNSRRS